jgi:hypothetical protein
VFFTFAKSNYSHAGAGAAAGLSKILNDYTNSEVSVFSGNAFVVKMI